MGYVADPPQQRFSALSTGPILGMVWAVWRVVPDMQAQQSRAFIAGQRAFSVLVGILIVWVCNNTKGSVLAAILLHDVDNVSVYAPFPEGSFKMPAVTVAFIAAAVAVVTLI